MTDAVETRASINAPTNAPAPSDTSSGLFDVFENTPATLHETFMEVAEHLRETGDFNERAYVAMCNIARDAHTMRDETVLMLSDALERTQAELREAVSLQKEASETIKVQSLEAKRALERANKLKVESMKQVLLARQQIAEAEAWIMPFVHIVQRRAPNHVKMQQLFKAIQKTSAPTRRLRSGRLF